MLVRQASHAQSAASLEGAEVAFPDPAMMPRTAKGSTGSAPC
jgi:hypothetical protein